jgi:hypothetical protein
VTAQEIVPAAAAAVAGCRYDQFALSLDPVTARSYHDATLPQVRWCCSSARLISMHDQRAKQQELQQQLPDCMQAALRTCAVHLNQQQRNRIHNLYLWSWKALGTTIPAQLRDLH